MTTEQTPSLALPPGPYTAGQILDAVIARITNEPRRLNMRDWVVMLQHRSTRSPFAEVDEGEIPACGTVACVGGWICILTRQDRYNGRHAFRALGLDVAVVELSASDEGERVYRARRALDSLFGATYMATPTVLARLKEIRQAHPILDMIPVTVPEQS